MVFSSLHHIIGVAFHKVIDFIAGMVMHFKVSLFIWLVVKFTFPDTGAGADS